jgi:NAD(P)H-hydrate epimerase
MKIFSSEQIRQIDDYTVRNEPVASIDLMERAAGKLAAWYSSEFERSMPLHIFVGPGNNGGDGLALARLLACNRYSPEVYYINMGSERSGNWETNFNRLVSETDLLFSTIDKIDQFPRVKPGSVIVDAILGYGLSRPVNGLAAQVIRQINNSAATIISIDVPSGLSCDNDNGSGSGSIIRADYTLAFQFPRLSFMFPENGKYTGRWTLLPIGLHKDIITATDTPYILVENEHVRKLLRRRDKFDHKGKFGHGLLIAGSRGKIGASVLGARAALRAGIGLLTCHIPDRGDFIMHTSVPEAMVDCDKSGDFFSGMGNTDQFDAAAVGPGIGTGEETSDAFHRFLLKHDKPLVIDADGLNILSGNKRWLREIRSGTILTPHPGEFERLVGKTTSGFDRLMKQLDFSERYNCIVVLKGAYTSVSVPGRRVWFNSTGNPGMATAGSGDVLTGVILSLLAQGYEPVEAAIAGVYIHGLAGDIAAEKSCQEAVIASDIINEIGSSFKRIRET